MSVLLSPQIVEMRCPEGAVEWRSMLEVDP
jgi:hypothetical protein